MNGRRTRRGWAENWARIELPNVWAVMPVPSETKYTVRSGIAVVEALVRPSSIIDKTQSRIMSNNRNR
jgi:hypothetical protein